MGKSCRTNLFLYASSFVNSLNVAAFCLIKSYKETNSLLSFEIWALNENSQVNEVQIFRRLGFVKQPFQWFHSSMFEEFHFTYIFEYAEQQF